MKFLKNLGSNQVMYWLGMSMMFTGLSLSVSVATALAVCGGIIAFVEIATSYLNAWLERIK